MEERVMNIPEYDKFAEWFHKDPLYSDYQIHNETLLINGDKLAFHSKHNVTPIPGKHFPGTHHEMHKPSHPLNIFGVATFRNGKLIKVEQRGDGLRRAVGVPGDHLDGNSYLNKYTHNNK